MYVTEPIERCLPLHSSSFDLNLFSQELRGFRNGLSVTGGDLGSWCQLFFDNLSTLLGVIFAMQGLTQQGGISASAEYTNQIIWGQIVPGVGITMVLGNIYYSWQAIRYVKIRDNNVLADL
jgi:hypothetical protein